MEEVLVHKLEGGLEVVRFDDRSPEDPPAFVTFLPSKMHVHRPIWRLAELDGHDYSRFIIAHEIGHLVLHKDQAMAFSGQLAASPTYYPEHECSEWQANMFALHFLIPPEVTQQLNNIDAIVELCRVPELLACEAVAKYRDQQRRAKYTAKHDGSICSECGNFTLVHNSTFLKCDTCGATSGVS